VLRRILGPKRKEDGSWRKMNNDKYCPTKAYWGVDLQLYAFFDLGTRSR
jgi:hypothetical protein